MKSKWKRQSLSERSGGVGADAGEQEQEVRH